MVGEDQACPHCGAALPSVPDAFCSECRNPLDAAPRAGAVGAAEVTSGGEPMQPEEPLPWRMLLPFNLIGLVILAASFFPVLGICYLLGDDRDGLKLALGGPLALVLDLIYRLRSPSGDLLLPGRGGKFLYLPLWVCAIFWCSHGLWLLYGGGA